MEKHFILSGIADESADDFAQQLQMHKDLGWRYIEIRNVNRIVIDSLDEKGLQKVHNMLEKNEIKVSCLASDIGKLELSGKNFKPFSKDLESLERLILAARKLDCTYIRVMGYRQGELSNNEWCTESIKRLKKLASIAEKEEIFLALENCIGWHAKSGKNMKILLEKVNSPNLVCLFDTGNPLVDQVWSYYNEVKDLIRYIHIKDRVKDNNSFTYPSSGQSMIKEILKDQYERGYRGFISIEPHMSSSAHLPNLKGDANTSWQIYKEYGIKINEIVKEIYQELT